MGISCQSQGEGRDITIRVTGRFDFSIHREFRECVKRGKSAASSYIVDMAGTDYMDSAALGMLLLLREDAGGDDARVRLTNLSPEIRRILEISNFQKLFVIE